MKPDGVLCVYKNGKNETARSCFYGGRCDGKDCCEYIILTGHSRPKDKANDKYPYNYCTAYKHITPEERRQINEERASRIHKRQTIDYVSSEGW